MGTRTAGLYNSCDTTAFKVMHINRRIDYEVFLSFEARRGAGAQSVTVNVIDCGFDPTRGHEIFI